jgi:hypothetical protein
VAQLSLLGAKKKSDEEEEEEGGEEEVEKRRRTRRTRKKKTMKGVISMLWTCRSWDSGWGPSLVLITVMTVSIFSLSPQHTATLSSLRTSHHAPTLDP